MNKEQELQMLRTDCGYNEEQKRKWHNACRRYLKQLGTILTPIYGEYDVRSNMGGIAVSGEVTLHMDRLYVQVNQSFLGNDHSILYRTCRDRKDYSGGTNNFAAIYELQEPEALAEKIIRRVGQPK